MTVKKIVLTIIFMQVRLFKILFFLVLIFLVLRIRPQKGGSRIREATKKISLVARPLMPPPPPLNPSSLVATIFGGFFRASKKVIFF